MTEQIYDQLEQELGALYASVPLSDSFVNSLEFQLNSKIRASSAPRMRPLQLRPAWIALIVLAAAIVLTALIIGPDKVYAEMRRLLGYIPGVGLVDEGAPIRVLAEPVEQTRDGVTITVTSAVLSSDRTHLEYRVFGVPRSANPTDENVTGCLTNEYLLLPDGTRLERMNDFPAVPADVNEAVLVIPCIANTLPGTVPENWELNLRFVPAPPDMTVMPVIEISPTVAPTAMPVNEEQSTAVTVDESVNVTQVIETETGFILVGEFKPQTKDGEWIQQTGMPEIIDAKGLKVPLKMNLDAMNNIQTGPEGWVYEIDTVGVSFPITITFNGVAISQSDLGESVEIPFDFGGTVVPGQEWTPDLKFNLAGHTVNLAGISADSQGGYSFNLLVDSSVYGLSVQIKDQTSNGGGGGGGGGLTDGKFSTSLSFTQLPTGNQTLVFSKLTVISDPLSWSGTWSPAKERTELPATAALLAGTCGTAVTLHTLPDLPAEMTGKALIYEPMPDGDTWGLVVYNLDGSGRSVVDASANWGAMNLAGTEITYPVESGFNIFDLATGRVIFKAVEGGYDPLWSNDGKLIAYINGTASGLLVMEVDTGEVHQISSLGFESTVGWIPDDSRLITAAMFSGGAAWQIRSIDPNTGVSEDLFVIEDGSHKALNAVLSPDGEWIAYRGRNNSDVRLVKLDGSENHVLLDNPSVGTTGLIWAQNGWLGVSLAQMDSELNKIILFDPVTCKNYKVTGLTGILEGLFID